MAAISTFTSDKWTLLHFLERVEAREIQLPDFQRGWIWDDDHLKSLLASVSLSYPIGTVMMLTGGNPEVSFKPRPVEGVLDGPGNELKWLLLDGQQRLTSLYLALLSGKPVPTRDSRDNRIQRWYYIRIDEALDPEADREEAIIGLPADRIVRDFRAQVVADFSTPEREYEGHLFPLAQVADCADWRIGFEEFWDHDKEKVKIWNRFEKEVVKRFEQYLLPFIQLGAETPKEAVCQIFEKVNTGGVPLTVFELLTATFAADNFSLRDDWAARQKLLRNRPQLADVTSTDFLATVTLLATRARRIQVLSTKEGADKAPAIGCKKKDILRLSLAQYQAHADTAMAGYEAAARLLHAERIFTARDVPYKTQLQPLAAVLAVLGKDGEIDAVQTKLRRWYWSGVFGELYGSAVESRFARDLAEVPDWARGGAVEPLTVTEATFTAERLSRLKSRGSAAYKGIYALLMRDGGLDFRSGVPIEHQTYFDDRIDIHHIFPQKWCADHKVDPRRCDSIANKTAISARTNRVIGGNAPSVYLSTLQKQFGMDEPRLDGILASHRIDPALIRGDKFDAFLLARSNALLDLVEGATGKPVQRLEIGSEAVEEPSDFEIEDVA